ncbi:DUF1722 domain-containing protein, partial [Escherichia coli]
ELKFDSTAASIVMDCFGNVHCCTLSRVDGYMILGNPRDHTNVLMHVQGYFRPHIYSTERQQLAALIDSYRRGEQPLLAPLMRIKHYMALYPNAWLSGQRYFELWPHVINLRHSGVL